MSYLARLKEAEGVENSQYTPDTLLPKLPKVPFGGFGSIPPALIVKNLSPETESAIRAWLAQIGETDPATIAQVLDQCRDDTDALAYFIRRARGLPC